MNIRHKLIRFIQQPQGIIDKILGYNPFYTNYFYTIKKICPHIDTYIDIGANEGVMVRACKRVFPKATIHAFEPIKEKCDKILSDLFHYENLYTYNFGLWNKNKTGDFFFVKERDVESSFLLPATKDYTEIRKVELKRFDSLGIELKGKVFVKIDVEGADDKVLEGMGNLLEKVDFIQIEQTHSERNKGEKKMSKVMEILENYGFKEFIQVNLCYFNDGFPANADLIFFKDDKKEREY